MGKSRFSRFLMDFLRSRVPRYVSPFVRSRHARMQIPRLTRNAEGVRALIRGTNRLDPQGNINLYRTAAQAEKALLQAGRIANRSTVNNNMRHLIGSSAHGLRVGFNKVAPWALGGLGFTALGAYLSGDPTGRLVDYLTTSGWGSPRKLPQNASMWDRVMSYTAPGPTISAADNAKIKTGQPFSAVRPTKDSFINISNRRRTNNLPYHTVEGEKHAGVTPATSKVSKQNY